MGRSPALEIRIFSDQDLAGRPAEVEAALQGAQVLFASLIFDDDQVEWLRPRIAAIPTRLVFESALELMVLPHGPILKVAIDATLRAAEPHQKALRRIHPHTQPDRAVTPWFFNRWPGGSSG